MGVKDHVFMKLLLVRGVLGLGLEGELCPRYIGLLEIFEKLRNVAYGLLLHLYLTRICKVFYILMLEKKAIPSM